MGLYTMIIVVVSFLGHWETSDWIRGMLLDQQLLFALFFINVEMRSFMWVPGAKLFNFYEVYARHEIQQMFAQWADICEEAQNKHLVSKLVD